MHDMPLQCQQNLVCFMPTRETIDRDINLTTGPTDGPAFFGRIGIRQGTLGGLGRKKHRIGTGTRGLYLCNGFTVIQRLNEQEIFAPSSAGLPKSRQ